MYWCWLRWTKWQSVFQFIPKLWRFRSILYAGHSSTCKSSTEIYTYVSLLENLFQNHWHNIWNWPNFVGATAFTLLGKVFHKILGCVFGNLCPFCENNIWGAGTDVRLKDLAHSCFSNSSQRCLSKVEARVLCLTQVPSHQTCQTISSLETCAVLKIYRYHIVHRKSTKKVLERSPKSVFKMIEIRTPPQW